MIHVGRIGVEKSLELLKRLDFFCKLDSLLLRSVSKSEIEKFVCSVMDKLPEARIAFIGDGPYRCTNFVKDLDILLSKDF